MFRLNSDNGVASVHDHAASKAFRYDAEVAPTKTKISFIEPETGGKISGLGGAGIFTVTDEASGKKASLKMKPSHVRRLRLRLNQALFWDPRWQARLYQGRRTARIFSTAVDETGRYVLAP